MIRKCSDMGIKCWAYGSFMVVLCIICGILYFLFSKGFFLINVEFLTQNPKGMPLGTEGGIRGSIIGSFLLMILSMFFSALLGVSCAIFNVIYNTSKHLKGGINICIQCVSSVPSILIGLFVYGFFIVTWNLPQSLLTASFALSIMVFPFVEINTEKAIQDMDRQFIKDSKALGVDSTYCCRKLILPLLKRNILSILLLAGSYAVGATAPLLLTGVVFMTHSTSLIKPVMALPFHLHTLLGQSVAIEKAYATAVVLILMLVLIHILANVILQNIGGVLSESIRNKKS